MYERNYQASVLKEKSVKTEKKKFSWKRFFKIFLTLLFLFGIGFLLRHPKFQVFNIEVLGTEVISKIDIEDNIKEQLVGKYLWIFPKSSIFLINERSIKEKVKNNFSRIETINIKRADFHSIKVDIKEFQAEFLWCGKNQEDCYFMDKQGFVYSKAPVFSGTAYSKIFVDLVVKELPFSALSVDNIKDVTEISERLLAINIIPTTFDYVSERQLDIDFLHNKSISKIIIDPRNNVETSLEYVFSGIRTEPLSSKFHNPNKKLLYIDVRFPSKIIYKFDEGIKTVEEEQ
ncbi:MAG: hypothetical protein KBC11_01425 [Candidatus Pacebacteria bacterium]|nr:hypothetical protein [Candidatus Paceibacterota bacterium]